MIIIKYVFMWISSFKLERHWAALLSSSSEDYKNGNTLRGFRLLCTWGENQCEYAFVIRTDAL